MARLVRSPRAKRDINEVLGYTKERWGKAQALEYRELIREALRAVAIRGRPGPALTPGFVDRIWRIPRWPQQGV